MFALCFVTCVLCMTHCVWYVVQHCLLCGLCVNCPVLQSQDEQQLKEILKAGIGEPLKMVVYNSKSRNCRGEWEISTPIAPLYACMYVCVCVWSLCTYMCLAHTDSHLSEQIEACVCII